MIKHICDACERNEASRAYKVQERIVYKAPIPNGASAGEWGQWEEIEICEECAEWLLAVKVKEAR